MTVWKSDERKGPAERSVIVDDDCNPTGEHERSPEVSRLAILRDADDGPTVPPHDGRVRDLVRVYSGSNPDVMTLQSDLAFPPSAFSPLSRCVHEKLATEFSRAIFLAGTPVEREADIGFVEAIATTDELEADIRDAGIELTSRTGFVGGVTGALAKDCFHNDVPAAVLIVHADPYLPDPGPAQLVIENALEQLVDFDIDTSELKAQSDQINRCNKSQRSINRWSNRRTSNQNLTPHNCVCISEGRSL